MKNKLEQSRAALLKRQQDELEQFNADQLRKHQDELEQFKAHLLKQSRIEALTPGALNELLEDFQAARRMLSGDKIILSDRHPKVVQKMCMPTPLEVVHKADYQKRFKALQKALAGLVEDDRRALHKALADGEIEERLVDEHWNAMGIKDIDPPCFWPTSFQQRQFDRMLDNMKATAEVLSNAELNKRGRVKNNDQPLQVAVALWRHHVSVKIGTQEDGPFWKFATLFLESIGRERNPVETGAESGCDDRVLVNSRMIREAVAMPCVFNLRGRKVGACSK